MPKTKLNDGNTIPMLGLGLWKVTDEAEFNNMFEAAIAAGYDHFDDAQAYSNEQFLGVAWQKAGLRRQDIFITTKILVQHLSYQSTLKSFDESLKKLQTDYVDLLLVHFPGPPWLRKQKWKAMEQIKRAGKARSIGVSNHYVKHLKQMESYASEMPAVNQIEMHVFMQQKATKAYCDKLGIRIEAYSPLAHARVMDDKLIQSIADKHGKSYSQVMLAWCLDQGVIPLPKSVSSQRLKENIEIFDFKLDKYDLKSLASLDRGYKTLWHSILFN